MMETYLIRLIPPMQAGLQDAALKRKFSKCLYQRANMVKQHSHMASHNNSLYNIFSILISIEAELIRSKKMTFES